jgi:predicted Fe-S protein YdhL (DUF1289 family)
MSELQQIVSPCIGICEIDPEDGLCMGCLRTLREVADWRMAGDATRLDILQRLKQRRREIGTKIKSNRPVPHTPKGL